MVVFGLFQGVKGTVNDNLVKKCLNMDAKTTNEITSSNYKYRTRDL